MNYFIELNKVDVNEKIERKNGLSYLAWAYAWAELKKQHPTAFYTIYENADGLFYHTDGKTCWVKTGVTVNVDDKAIEHIEYLPVMDYRNKSIPVDSVTSFDVNKAIQRSLTKAVARHGLGLYIYAGEDLPEDGDTKPEPPKKQTKKEREDHANARIEGLCNYHKIDISTFEHYLKTLQDEGKVPAGKVTDMSEQDLGVTISMIHAALNATMQPA